VVSRRNSASRWCFPVDALKTGRASAGRIGPGGTNSEIARTIVTLAQSLDMKVVADGIFEAE